MTKKDNMLDAINASLEPETDPVDPPEPKEEDENEAPEAPADDADKPAGDDAPAEDDAPVGDDEAGGEAKGDTDGKKGKKADDEVDLDKPAAPKPEPKPLDPLNDPIPTTVSDRTRERITSLVSMVKEKDQQIETGTELFRSISETGVSPENFAQTLTFLRMFNSPRIDDKRQAYTFMAGELKALAEAIGEVVPGTDPLAGHQDLIDAVAAHSTTQALAEEVARSRARSKAETTAVERQSTEAQQWETARVAAVADLNELEGVLRAADTNYDAKRPALLEKMKTVAQSSHPSTWVRTLQKLYKEMPAPAAPKVKTPSGPQPLRPKQPAGQGTKQPASILEAMNVALDGK